MCEYLKWHNFTCNHRGDHSANIRGAYVAWSVFTPTKRVPDLGPGAAASQYKFINSTQVHRMVQ